MIRLNLTSKTFQSNTVRAVDHPEQGELLSAVDALRAVGFSMTIGAGSRLNSAGAFSEDRIVLSGNRITSYDRTQLAPTQGPETFLARMGVNKLLISSNQPQA